MNENLESRLKILLRKVHGKQVSIDEFLFSQRKDDVGSKQQANRLKKVETFIERALWFLDCFGLEHVSVKLREKSSGNIHVVGKEFGRNYNELNDNEKEIVKSIVYIMDSFCVGDQPYHELCMAVPNNGLPKSYLIGQCRRQHDSLYTMHRTPGRSQGVQVDFVDELKRAIITTGLGEDNIPDKPIKVKISGDGAKCSRNSHFTTISFTLLDDEAKSVFPLAIVKSPESYEMLASSCSLLFKDINDVIKEGKIELSDGKFVDVDLYLCADMKFLLLILGRTGATSTFSCIWCYIHKADRYDMSHDDDFYNEEKQRTLQADREHVLTESYGCRYLPLLNIEVNRVIPDELHLFLRITDNLLDNIKTYAQDRDKKASIRGNKSTFYIDTFTKCVQQCGVSFNIWPDPSDNGVLRYTPLMGNDKKKVLEKLPSFFPSFVEEDKIEEVKALWVNFQEIYHLISSTNLPEETIENFPKKAKHEPL